MEYPKRKRPRLKDFDYSLPYYYFLTICSFKKEDFFRNDNLARMVIQTLFEMANGRGVHVHSYCLMPNHLHLLINPLGSNLLDFVREFKGVTTRLSWHYGISKRLWQSSFYDHVVRLGEKLPDVSEYILLNPVRKGICENWEAYPYSGIVPEMPCAEGNGGA